jgi:dTDP-4-amino-4,6-dideoxygalactose transaminase
VTNDAALAAKMRVLRDHGQESKYHHSLIGWNARMDGIQGAVLRVKLKQLDRGNAARRQHAKLYGELLADMDNLVLPTVADYSVHVFHLYVVRVRERDRILQTLGQRGISCGIHYPKPVHLQKAYESLGLKAGSFPVAEQSADTLLSLPMYPELTATQIEVVVNELKATLPRVGKREPLGV